MLADCIGELFSRVEALEADRYTHPGQPDADPSAPAPAGSLVEKVAMAMYDAGGLELYDRQGLDQVARAAVLAVADWLEFESKGGTDPDPANRMVFGALATTLRLRVNPL
jgi:hypothetical protein